MNIFIQKTILNIIKSKEIVESFGEFNDLILIVPNNQQVKELSLVGN